MSAPQAANRAAQLRQTHRLARRIDRALAAMRAGESLHLQYRDGRPLWNLSGGRIVTAEAANLVIRHEHVRGPADAALFDGMAQTWRFDP